jgi:hypothetical protein
MAASAAAPIEVAAHLPRLTVQVERFPRVTVREDTGFDHWGLRTRQDADSSSALG